MKRAIAAVIAAVTVIVSLSGCGGIADSQIKNRLIIQAVGFDSAENGQIKLSVQVLNTDVSTNASSNSVPEKLVKYYTAVGENMTQCIESIRRLTGKNPLLSQNRTVIFSLEFAEKGIGRIIDSYLRNNENRITVTAAVSLGSAEEIIRADTGDNTVPARLCEQILHSPDTQTVTAEIYEIANCICGTGRCAVLPVISLYKSGSEKTFRVEGCAVFERDRLVHIKNSETAQGIKFLTDSVKSGAISVDIGDNTAATLNFISSRTRIKPYISEGAVRFDITVGAKLVITEISSETPKRLTAEAVRFIQERAEMFIKSSVQAAVDGCIINDGADVCGFARRVWRRYPDYYREHEENTAPLIFDAQYSITVNTEIIRAGDSAVK